MPVNNSELQDSDFSSAQRSARSAPAWIGGDAVIGSGSSSNNGEHLVKIWAKKLSQESEWNQRAGSKYIFPVIF